MAAWEVRTVKRMRAVRAGGNTLLRVRWEEPLGESPAACHLRAVLAAFLEYATKKGTERGGTKAQQVPLYTVTLTAEPSARCTTVRLTFSFAGERPPVTLTEYWCGEGTWQTARPPRETRRSRQIPQNSKKFAKIQKEISQKPLEIQKKM